MNAKDLEQRHRALRLGNRVRTRRAIAKIVLRNSGDRATSYPELAALLADPPAELAGARIDKILYAAPGIGSKRVASCLRYADVRASTAIDRISSRQRGLISAALTPSPETDMRRYPSRPLVAAGITGALASTSMPASVIAHWFHTSRSELAGRTPKQVLVEGRPGDAQIVLELARSDAAALPGDPDA